ncbi:MAG TPA: response regulator [Myxococcales bacterium]|nr:response regulator [Myxococcales bacterium]
MGVLVVDDDPRILATFRRTAKDLPLQMRYATTVAEAMKMVEERPPAVLICDYRLPDGDGLTVLERVGDRFPAVKRILHTGEAVMRVSFGFDVPVLGKPCSQDTLRELLESFTRGEP